MLPARLFGSHALLVAVFLMASQPSVAEGDQAEAQKPPAAKIGAEQNPFGNLEPASPTSASQAASPASANWFQRFTHENFTFRVEVFSQFAYGYRVQDHPFYSRQSGGFEMLKKFSTATSTIAAFDVQFRMVRRDHWLPVQDDMEGATRAGWHPEYHNVYLDLYNVFNPLMSDSERGRHVGRFNFRIGRFYLPFGINLQTDTHATVLQLSNGRNFGFERDWYAGFYGSLTRDLNYDLYYSTGSGYYPRFGGQHGLLGARISLGNRFLNEHGLEGGVAFVGGRRISEEAVTRSPSVAAKSPGNYIVRTLRFGLDGRYTRPVRSGTVALTTELSAGQDESDALFGDLHQLEYLARSRKWGWAAQYRRFWQNIRPVPAIGPPQAPRKADSSVAGEFTYYLRNDIGAARLHWLKFNVERQLERQEGDRIWLFTVQYYLYW